MAFHDESYKSHQQIKHDSHLVRTWRNEKSVDYWRHERMYSQLEPLLDTYSRSKWLTIGDGRYGTDAHYLEQKGATVIATDINDTYLKQASEEGFISAYAIENAERLSYDDGSFDFVLCKESYHHFPRPMIALYEMLRVCRKGIVLMEPNDQSIFSPYTMGLSSATYWFWFVLKQTIKKMLGRDQATFPVHYESTGNYIYTVSHRELIKTGLGLNLDLLATKGLNDFYIKGVENENINDNGPLFTELKKKLSHADATSLKRPETYGLLVAILFKTNPHEECISALNQKGFSLTKLEKNPYIKD